jgi:hypothetical protein
VYSNLISQHIYEEDILVLKRTVPNKIALYFFKHQAAKSIGRILNIAANILNIGTRWIEILFQALAALPPKKTVPG